LTQFAADRRLLLRAAALGGLSWLTPVAEVLARRAEREPKKPAQSLIVVWLAGGPSQLETFDPHAGKSIAGDTRSIRTCLPGIELAEGFEQLADVLKLATLVRNVYSKEGDHDRGSYLLKTGYRPDPTLIHPSIGAICCRERKDPGVEIPRHITILPERFSGQGGWLGAQYDPFRTGDPREKVPDVVAKVDDARQRARLDDELVIERAFARGREQAVQATMHRQMVDTARRMMTSEQLKAFDVSQEPKELQAAYGNTPFGRGCLAARRLIEVGVRCVEVTLTGWDSHVKNHEIQRAQVDILDPALSTLLTDLEQRGLLASTVVLCGGEFGRSPAINRLGGRDHWPGGFSVLVAGGRLRRGHVVGETDPEGKALKPEQSTSVADLHATLLSALGINFAHEESGPFGRLVKYSEGQPLAGLVEKG